MLLIAAIFPIGFYASDETSLGHNEGLAFGRSSDISAYHSKSIDRMQICADFKCEVHENGIAKGCAETEKNQSFCSGFSFSTLNAAVKIKEACQQKIFSEKTAATHQRATRPNAQMM